MSHPLVVKISKGGGSTTLVFHPDKQCQEAQSLTEALGSVLKEQRGAYVYPLNKAKRALFKVLRGLFGGAGWVAEWTRQWRGPWVVVLPGEHVRLPGEFETHDAAVDAEVDWILHHKVSGGA